MKLKGKDAGAATRRIHEIYQWFQSEPRRLDQEWQRVRLMCEELRQTLPWKDPAILDLDVPAWDGLSEAARADFSGRIERLQAELELARGEATDPGWFQSKAPASAGVIICLLLGAIGLMIGLGWVISEHWGDAVNTPSAAEAGPHERQILQMIFCFGGLGGSVRVLASLVKYIGHKKLARSWIPFYVVTPFLGAGLAAIACLLLRVGILSPSGTNNGSGLENLNVFGMYALAGMTGLFSKNVLDKLAELVDVMFQGPRKDPDSLERG